MGNHECGTERPTVSDHKLVARDFLFGRFNAEVETGFILKPSWNFDRNTMSGDDFTEVRPNESRVGPWPVHHARKRCRPGPDRLPERHDKAGFFAKLYFKFHNVYFRDKMRLLFAWLWLRFPSPTATRLFLAATGRNLGFSLEGTSGTNEKFNRRVFKTSRPKRSETGLNINPGQSQSEGRVTPHCDCIQNVGRSDL